MYFCKLIYIYKKLGISKPPMTTITIQGKPFSYEDELTTLTRATITPITQEEGKLILETTKTLFDEIGLEFCLAYGTLLGAVREGGIIPGDEDVDIYIKDEEKLFNKLPWLYDRGLKLIRMVKGGLYSFRINDRCYIDAYVLKPVRFSVWTLYCYSLNKHVQPKRFFDEQEEIDFLGQRYLCPKHPETLLEWWYGPDWRTPKHSKKGHYDVTSYKKWSKFRLKILKIGEFCLGYKYWRKSK